MAVFTRISASPRWFGFSVVIPVGGLAVGAYATGIFISQGANVIFYRQNVIAPIPNSPASSFAIGDVIDPTRSGVEPAANFPINNIYPSPFNYAPNTELLFSVIGDSIVSGSMNFFVFLFEAH